MAGWTLVLSSKIIFLQYEFDKHPHLVFDTTKLLPVHADCTVSNIHLIEVVFILFSLLTGTVTVMRTELLLQNH